MTTIDWYCCKGKGIGHNYDHGKYNNITDTLGYFPCWIFPIRIGTPGDGAHFIPTNLPQKSEEEAQLLENP